jgi:hypothetical protein
VNNIQGNNDYGERGGTVGNILMPSVVSLSGVSGKPINLLAGSYNGLFLTSNGAIYSWVSFDATIITYFRGTTPMGSLVMLTQLEQMLDILPVYTSMVHCQE